jgi:type IV secretory pathway VirJ component
MSILLSLKKRMESRLVCIYGREEADRILKKKKERT